ACGIAALCQDQIVYLRNIVRRFATGKRPHNNSPYAEASDEVDSLDQGICPSPQLAIKPASCWVFIGRNRRFACAPSCWTSWRTRSSNSPSAAVAVTHNEYLPSCAPRACATRAASVCSKRISAAAERIFFDEFAATIASRCSASTRDAPVPASYGR